MYMCKHTHTYAQKRAGARLEGDGAHGRSHQVVQLEGMPRHHLAYGTSASYRAYGT